MRHTKDRESDTATLYPLSTELNIQDTESADTIAIDGQEDGLKKAQSTTTAEATRAEATRAEATAAEATTAEASTTEATTAEVNICTPYPVTRTGY